MTRIMEAPDWVVMAWRCEDEEQAMRRASRLHSQSERDEFMRRYRWLSNVRRLWGDGHAADKLIKRGETRLARRQPLRMEQVYLTQHVLGSSVVRAPMSDCLLVLGSFFGAWYPRKDYYGQRVYRQLLMSDEVAGIALGDDGKAFPIFIGWQTQGSYGVASEEDCQLLVDHVYADGSIELFSPIDDDYEDDDEDDDEDVQYGGALHI